VTVNGVDQAVQAGCRHCGIYSSVASSPRSSSVMCVWYTVSCNIFHMLLYINWIQIWRIWRTQSRWDKFWSFFL